MSRSEVHSAHAGQTVAHPPPPAQGQWQYPSTACGCVEWSSHFENSLAVSDKAKWLTCHPTISLLHVYLREKHVFTQNLYVTVGRGFIHNH